MDEGRPSSITTAALRPLRGGDDVAEVTWRRTVCDGGGRGAMWEASRKAGHASPCGDMLPLWGHASPLPRRAATGTVVTRAWRGKQLGACRRARRPALAAAVALFGRHPNGRHDGRMVIEIKTRSRRGRRQGVRAGRPPTSWHDTERARERSRERSREGVGVTWS